jgi:hypothetical protein
MTNEQFEAVLTEACKKHLKPEIDAEKYASLSLDELWDGETYSDADGDRFYFEIPARYTKSGNPVVV